MRLTRFLQYATERFVVTRRSAFGDNPILIIGNFVGLWQPLGVSEQRYFTLTRQLSGAYVYVNSELPFDVHEHDRLFRVDRVAPNEPLDSEAWKTYSDYHEVLDATYRSRPGLTVIEVVES